MLRWNCSVSYGLEKGEQHAETEERHQKGEGLENGKRTPLMDKSSLCEAVNCEGAEGKASWREDSRAAMPPPRKGRTAKALKSLQFANPGRQTEFAAEPGRRDKRRLQPNKTATNADRQTIGAKSKVYDSAGLLISSGLDLCDCLDEDCLGCFYPCPECRSRKCGVECRCDRKWLYEQVEIEGGEIIRNKHVG